jgi:hypothetical protein
MEFLMKCPFCHTDPLTITSNVALVIARTPGKEFKRKILCCAWNNVSSFTSIPKGWFPVVPSTKSVECYSNEFYRTKIQMHQFPCVLSLVLTGHKTQGLNTESIILACLAPKDKSGVSGWLYVILSRVKTIEGLFLRENIEKKSGKIRRKI